MHEKLSRPLSVPGSCQAWKVLIAVLIPILFVPRSLAFVGTAFSRYVQWRYGEWPRTPIPNLLSRLLQGAGQQGHHPPDDLSLLYQFLLHFIMHQINANSLLPNQRKAADQSNAWREAI